MLSASDMPVPQTAAGYPRDAQPTTVLLLPSFTVVEHVTPQSVPDLIAQLVSPGPTNTTLLPPRRPLSAAGSQPAADAAATATPPPTAFRTHPSPHAALILLCSQKTRDARCGQSAPLLRREFERQLRPLGLYRDAHDDRPGGVRVIFISHVGGHKFSANVIVYRKAAAFGAADGAVGQEAGQCIWLARVRPADCEGIVQFTVLQGKVVKPERQLRGGFDREKGLVSW
jgi:(2Fe-2S) ferredoxin